MTGCSLTRPLDRMYSTPPLDRMCSNPYPGQDLDRMYSTPPGQDVLYPLPWTGCTPPLPWTGCTLPPPLDRIWTECILPPPPDRAPAQRTSLHLPLSFQTRPMGIMIQTEWPYNIPDRTWTGCTLPPPLDRIWTGCALTLTLPGPGQEVPYSFPHDRVTWTVYPSPPFLHLSSPLKHTPVKSLPSFVRRMWSVKRNLDSSRRCDC